jgi:phenylacetate-CoA ligase
MPSRAAGSASCRRHAAPERVWLVTMPLLDLPRSRAEIERLQSERKKHALAQARRAPFYKGKLDHVNTKRLDDPNEWRKIPLLHKDALRKLDDRKFYEEFCGPR